MILYDLFYFINFNLKKITKMKKINNLKQLLTAAALLFCTQSLFANYAGADTFLVRSYKASHGTVSPSGYANVVSGGSVTYTFTADSGYQVRNVFIDGDSVGVGAVTSYTFTNVTANHTIRASFTAAASYKIRSYKAANGTISPSGNTSVASGGSQTYTFTADSGYEVRNVFVDGDSIGAVTSYTFTNVTANHTIRASFKQSDCKLGNLGEISVSQQANLCSGDTVTCSISSVTGATSYTWSAPSGANIVSGQGTSSVQVTFGTDTTFTSGKLGVTASNSCGTSKQRKSVALYSRPSQPVISGDTCVSAKESGLVYTITNAESGVGYEWKVPGSAKITSGQGTTSVTVTWKDTSGVISVTASNDCGSVKGSLSVSTLCGESASSGLVVKVGKLSASVSPNPSSADAVLSISNSKSAVSITISSMSGKTIWKSSGIKTSQVSLPVQNLASGLYYVKVSDGISNAVVKLIKE